MQKTFPWRSLVCFLCLFFLSGRIAEPWFSVKRLDHICCAWQCWKLKDGLGRQKGKGERGKWGAQYSCLQSLTDCRCDQPVYSSLQYNNTQSGVLTTQLFSLISLTWFHPDPSGEQSWPKWWSFFFCICAQSWIPPQSVYACCLGIKIYPSEFAQGGRWGSEWVWKKFYSLEVPAVCSFKMATCG